MRIKGLCWDDENIDHIAQHGVSPKEVEDVCSGLHFSRKIRNQRYMLSGQAANGKYLNVILEPIGKGFFRPKTAFEMSETYKHSYRKRLR